MRAVFFELGTSLVLGGTRRLQPSTLLSPACAPPSRHPPIQAQQTQLEGALKSLKDYKEKDKWDKIAELVEGKTKKQCVERYKHLATLLKKK